MSQENNTQSAIDAGKQIATASQQIQRIGEIPFYFKHNGDAVTMERVLCEDDKRKPAPRRLTGKASFTELASFIEHVKQFKTATSRIFIADNTLTCVYNYHGADSPQWGDHRAAYVAPYSSQWALWTKNDGKGMSQETFGEFIDQNLADIVAPAPGKDGDADRQAGYVGAGQLATMARNLVINASHRAERKINEQTGEINMVFTVQNDETSSTKLPPGFLLGIPVFEAGAPYRVEAKFYLARKGQGFELSYRLMRVPEVLKHAVDEIRALVTQETSLPVWAGSPEQ